jgi:CheY-like chemotaxis protein
VRILVLDDDQVLARAIARKLKGHDVIVENDADHAVDRIVAGDWFDLVICDLNMPKRDGIEIIATIALHCGADRPTLALMSGSDEIASSSADVVLSKPFGVVEIQQLLALVAVRKVEQCIVPTQPLGRVRSA